MSQNLYKKFYGYFLNVIIYFELFSKISTTATNPTFHSDFSSVNLNKLSELWGQTSNSTDQFNNLFETSPQINEVAHPNYEILGNAFYSTSYTNKVNDYKSDKMFNGIQSNYWTKSPIHNQLKMLNSPISTKNAAYQNQRSIELFNQSTYAKNYGISNSKTNNWKPTTNSLINNLKISTIKKSNYPISNKIYEPKTSFQTFDVTRNHNLPYVIYRLINRSDTSMLQSDKTVLPQTSNTGSSVFCKRFFTQNDLPKYCQKLDLPTEVTYKSFETTPKESSSGKYIPWHIYGNTVLPFTLRGSKSEYNSELLDTANLDHYTSYSTKSVKPETSDYPVFTPLFMNTFILNAPISRRNTDSYNSFEQRYPSVETITQSNEFLQKIFFNNTNRRYISIHNTVKFSDLMKPSHNNDESLNVEKTTPELKPVLIQAPRRIVTCRTGQRMAFGRCRNIWN